MVTLDVILSFLETYKGRDRFLRLLCYSSKCSAGLIQSPELAKKFDNLSKQLSTSRACFRLLDDLPTVVDVVRSQLNKQEGTTTFKVVSTVENVVDVIFSPLDHISWAIEHRIINSNSSFWDDASTWCWVISLYINLYKIVLKLSKNAHEKATLGVDYKAKELKKELSAKEWYLIMSAVKCGADLLFAVNYLPKGLLWAQYFNKWQVGALGTLSSVVALYQSLILSS